MLSSSIQLSWSVFLLGSTHVLLLQGVGVQHGGWLWQGLLQLQVSFLLDGLGVLESLDQFHFQLLHLSDLVHLTVSQLLFFLTSIFMVSSGDHLLSSSLLLDLHLGESLRLESNLILHLIFLFHSKIILSLFLLVLLLYHFSLFRFFLLLQQQSVLDFLFLVVPLLGNHVIILTHLSLLLVLKLNVKDFLKHID